MPDDVKATDPAEEDPQIKVTDRRMFTPDGELREEYRFLEDEKAAASESPSQASAAPADSAPATPAQATSSPAPGPAAPAQEPPAAAAAGPEGPPGAPPRERRPDLPELSGPPTASILDLVGMLAESAAVYLGDAKLPDGSSGEHLDMARLHIDLLDVLRQKTAGNLSVQESGALEDVLYRLRVRYVQKRG